MNWLEGQPTKPGWYLLQFSGGDQFVVVRAFFDEDFDFCMEDQTSCNPALRGYVSDCVDVIIKYLPIPAP